MKHFHAQIYQNTVRLFHDIHASLCYTANVFKVCFHIVFILYYKAAVSSGILCFKIVKHDENMIKLFCEQYISSPGTNTLM